MTDFPPKPAATHYLHHYGYQIPMWLGDWQWSYDFNRWSRHVEFYDGWNGYTYPQL